MSFTLPSRQLALTPSRSLPFRRRNLEERRGWRRLRRLTIRSNLFASPSPFECLFQSLITHFPSPNSLDLIAPALGFASGAALYLSRLRGDSRIRRVPVSDIGEWVLFTSPTPFNRFVTLRCPSISFPGSERLVKEERHFVRINSGRIQVRKSEENSDEKLVYQRLCVSMEDGGVVSLDWPANLDLDEERGLDTTFLIVPGIVEGSMDKDIRDFVCDCLRRGYFPVVMNPRGCAGSPLTTARLFTAADSDDISTVIQFINNRRPWSTLMGIGWGYGANMLTKYLAEAGEETPLIAATCIDNPFDLEEATRASPYFDQKLTSGLVDILQSNKELFQGRAKGFNVEKALISTSIRDFEKEISMVSYGFSAIEDFYAKSSTRHVVGRVKIPLLFIQNNDRSVPLFSVPQSSIAQNPFTSLILCSRLPLTEIMGGRSTISWCQNLSIEWLTAVEIGLLKGRHPLLQDVDVTINPSSVPALLMRPTDENVGVKKLLNLQILDSLDVHDLDSSKETFEESNTAASQNTGLLHEHNSTLVLDDRSDAKPGEEEAVDHNGSDRGQVLQAAEVVMNMLDMTMPDALGEEQKKKVLTAVGKGETLMNALQGAVPEDVRGKLTAAVSEIVHKRGSNLKLDGLLALGSIPSKSKSKSAVQEKVRGDSSAEAENESLHSSDGMKAGDLPNGSNKAVPSADNRPEELESEWQAPENLQRSDDTSQSQSMNSSSAMDKKEMTDLADNNENADHSGGQTALDSGTKENESKAGAEPESSNVSEGESAVENMDSEKYKMQQDGGESRMDSKEESSYQSKEEYVADSSGDKNKTMSNTRGEDESTSPASPSETPVMEKEGSDNIKREEKSMQTNSNQSITNTPGFSVSQAFDALTSIDDSTQVAVNSVFHVLEDMITQLEEGKNDENKMNDRDNNHEEKNEYAGTPSSDAIPSNNQSHYGEKTKEMHVNFAESCAVTKHSAERNKGKKQNIVKEKLSAEDSARYLNTVSQNVPIYVIKDLHGDPHYKENYLVSKARRTNSLDLDSTTALFLDYFPEDGQWKLLEQTENDSDSDEDVAFQEGGHSQPKAKDIDIEPSYVILDSGKRQEATEKSNGNVEIGIEKLEEPSRIIRKIILDALKVEVGRRLSSADMEEMGPELFRDLEHIANAVSQSVGLDDKLASVTDLEETDSEKVENLHGEHVVRAISSAFQNTSYLRRVLPVGVIVGSSLAALRKSFDVSAVENNGKGNEMILDQITKGEKGSDNVAVENNGKGNEVILDQITKGEKGSDNILSQNTNQKYELESSDLKTERRVESRNLNKSYIESRDDSEDSSKSIMVGAVTAALGASAFLVHHQENGTGNSTNPHSGKEDASKETHKLEDMDKTQDNIVTSLAEKAMSIASPVVPTKDGQVDQERLVAMLAELGQRGGILRFVGKFALLWGGLRGAMSLTNKLISFLHIAERPLFQRILAFICMVLVVWSPLAVPLLPTLVLSWNTHQPSKVAELVCVGGLYISFLLLVTLWGKRIRGYENPLEQYGLDLTSLSKVQDFIKGLIGGIILVLLIYSVNFLLGCVHLHFPITFPSSSSAAALAWLKVFSQMVVLAVQGLVIATGIAIVEELLFRSWLPDEIASDLGYNRGIIISGLAFSLFQRSLWAVPGLWILSLALSGIRKRNQGSLALPIGLRAGILASSFFLKTGGILSFESKFPSWFTGAYSQPFSGATGLAVALLLAIVVYPTEPLHKKKLSRPIKE